MYAAARGAGGDEPREWGLSDPMMYFAGQLLCKFLFPTSIPALPVDGVGAVNLILLPRRRDKTGF